MNIHPVNGLERVLPTAARTHAPRKAEVASDQVDFSRAEALNRALENQPESRADKVNRLRNVASSVNYPPEELIRGISRLIANHLTQTEEPQ